MTDLTPTPPPNIADKATPIVMNESAKLAAMALFCVAAGYLVKSEAVMGVVVMASGAIVTAIYGVWKRLSTWSLLKRLASIVDDSVATVGKAK